MPGDLPAKPVVTRFAPSPTGELHIGGARTALFSWAYARRFDGQFLLRFEDTDQKRSSKQAEANILRDLEWLGFRGDNHNDIPRQSQRLDLYNAAIQKLTDAGLTYEDGGALRLTMGQDISFRDEVYGPISVKADELEDFVIRKADGFPTFHLAVVVDDAAMGVTHVIRGQEHLSNTAKHARLYDALGYERPTWAHTPSIMNPDGSKMSKRDKAKAARAAALDAQKAGALECPCEDAGQFEAFIARDNDNLDIAEAIADALNVDLPEINVADFRRSGYLPGVLLNYLALLGWNPKDETDRFDLDWFVERFDLPGINKKNARFDREKLATFNQEKLASLPPDDFAGKLRAHFEEFHRDFIEKLGEGFKTFAAMYQPRSRTLDDPAALGAFFLHPPSEYDAKAVKKNLTKNDGEGLANLRVFAEALEAIEPWEAPTIQAALEAFTEQRQLKNMGGIAQPLRVALTGSAVSPPIDATLALLGKAEVKSRVARCLEAVSPTPAE
ncbi:MAG: hypothetical protein GVY24_01415 [Planctomycetes bacterium]|jgi:glutamyl-tRNA synthetase|nr:hypothetical protein [Planctomycetota bacterium]